MLGLGGVAGFGLETVGCGVDLIDSEGAAVDSTSSAGRWTSSTRDSVRDSARKSRSDRCLNGRGDPSNESAGFENEEVDVVLGGGVLDGGTAAKSRDSDRLSSPCPKGVFDGDAERDRASSSPSAFGVPKRGV